MKNVLLASHLVILLSSIVLAAFAQNGAYASDDSKGFAITVNHVDAQGVSTPFVDKELSFLMTYRESSSLAFSHTVKTNTDSNGQGTLTVPPQFLGTNFSGIELFCAKLDGPHYCNAVYATTTADPIQSLHPTDDQSEARYNCNYKVVVSDTGLSGSITVSCTDKTGQ
jgi:hypothetical protein